VRNEFAAANSALGAVAESAAEALERAHEGPPAATAPPPSECDTR
jgi:hypothetical protein